MSGLAQTNHTEKKDFLVRSSSLKDVRTFCREVFEKLHIEQNLKEELVLAIAEAAQNIVKHAYKDNPNTEDKMVVKHREIDNVKPGGLGTFFIQEIMDAVEFKDGNKPWINHLVLTKKL